MAWPLTDPEKLGEALNIADLAEGILDRKLLSLSNGELRRVLLARMWMEKPEWVYFNDLFGGLDPEYRAHLAGCVTDLAKRPGLNLVVRLAREDELLPEIPAFVYADKTFTQYEGELPKAATTPKFKKAELRGYEIVDLRNNSVILSGTPQGAQSKDPVNSCAEILFDLKHVNVRFGDTDVLKDLNWTVRKGEHWAVMGENGAGKSTLLGMLTADHPQIYNNDITLLGERPGHGLNIWDHKAKLGFFSPEMALQYREDLSLLDVLCTGFTPNLCRAENITWEEKAKAREWLTYLGFEDTSISIRKISPIDKRLVLMARAAIRPPKVLLLDEPTQGLKGEYREKLFHLLQLLSTETTIIMVSHYEEEWPPCMTHLLRMPKFSLN
jgi:molybdate transport system ATP-binding protein